MIDLLHREFVYVWYYFTLQLRQIFQYYTLGIVLGSGISVFVKDHIHGLFRALGDKKLGALGVIPASILGIASPLCMHGTIPLAASFSKSGIRDDWLAAFMMSSPAYFVQHGPGAEGADRAHRVLLCVRYRRWTSDPYLLQK